MKTLNIKCESLTKKYNNYVALENIDLSLNENKIYCVLGKNGAGKTTLFKILSGLIPNYEGRIYLDNNLIKNGEMSSHIHYVQSGVNHLNVSIKKLLELSASFYSNWDFEFASKMIEAFDLDINKKYNNLSMGMKAMVNIIIGLCCGTEIVIFDEVIAGCDSIVREKFYELLIEAYDRRPRTIIISTHLIDEISQIVEEIIILNKGKVLMNYSVEEIQEKSYTMGNMLLINLVLFPIFTVAINYKKMIYLGMKKKEYFEGIFLCYLILASSLSIINILLYYIEKNALLHTNLWYINVLDTFNWFRYGIFGCFIYQLMSYMVLMCFIHLIALSNDNVIGWILDIVIMIILLVFISTGWLRNGLGIFLKSLIFNENLFYQIIFCGIAICILYSLSKIFLNRKKM